MRTLVLILSEGDAARPLVSRVPAGYDVETSFRKKHVFQRAISSGYDAVAVFSQESANSFLDLPIMEKILHDTPSIDCLLGACPPFSISTVVVPLLNALTGARLKGWFSGVRVYRTRALASIPFDLNASDDLFDTEIVLQLLYNKARIRDFQGASTPGCRSLGALRGDIKAALKYRLQRYHLFYDVRYHPEVLQPTNPDWGIHDVYSQKASSRSPHSLVLSEETLVPPRSRVLDIGCAGGYLGAELVKKKSCRVTGIDILPQDRISADLDAYHRIDLENESDRVAAILSEGNFDRVLLLDVVEHLSSPEYFLRQLSRVASKHSTEFVVSTGNVAFIFIRLMLLLGHFNYGQKGILDITHKRLFSYHTFRNLLLQTGFEIVEERYCPLPFSELGFSSRFSRFCEGVNRFLMGLRPRLFSYQVLFRVRIHS